MQALSTRLREETKVAHTLAESATFVRCFLKGVIDRASYTKLLESLAQVYGAMEDALDHHRAHPVLSLLDFPELRRAPSLDEDLAFFRGPEWSPMGASEKTSSLATPRYVGRIRTVAYDRPELLVGHLYTRYLGDLSGGQVIRTIMQRQFGFDTNGVGFYLFGDIAKPREFKDTYREQLDAAPWDAAERTRVIDEVLVAYRFNTDLFRDLAEAKASSVA
ncbi:MAG: biliverdin-producing heme oxygenase [Mycetocola sp.]